MERLQESPGPAAAPRWSPSCLFCYLLVPGAAQPKAGDPRQQRVSKSMPVPAIEPSLSLVFSLSNGLRRSPSRQSWRRVMTDVHIIYAASTLPLLPSECHLLRSLLNRRLALRAAEARSQPVPGDDGTGSDPERIPRVAFDLPGPPGSAAQCASKVSQQLTSIGCVNKNKKSWRNPCRKRRDRGTAK